MLQNLNDKMDVVHGLTQLSHVEWGKPILKWLQDSLEDNRDQNDDLEGVPLYRGQGCAQTIKQFLKEVEEAPQSIKAMR